MSTDSPMAARITDVLSTLGKNTELAGGIAEAIAEAGYHRSREKHIATVVHNLPPDASSRSTAEAIVDALREGSDIFFTDDPFDDQ